MYRNRPTHDGYDSYDGGYKSLFMRAHREKSWEPRHTRHPCHRRAEAHCLGEPAVTVEPSSCQARANGRRCGAMTARIAQLPAMVRLPYRGVRLAR